MSWTDVTSHTAEIWDYISLYESYDYVAQLYEAFHDTNAASAKLREINTAFSQGRMYFDNARSANIVVKPVLLYYGVMSLCVGLILCKTRDRREASLPPSHGLRRVEWQRTLKSGVADVLSLKVRTCGGLFAELAKVLWNRHVSLVFQGELHKRDTFPYIHDLGKICIVNDRSPVSLGDLVSRSKYSGSAFAHVTGNADRIHRANVHLDPKRGNREIVVRFPISVGVIPKGFSHLLGQDGIEGIGKGLVFARNDTRIPVFHYDGPYFMSVVEDFPGGYKLSEFVKLYLISYILGMLARYFPSRWLSLVRNDRQASAQPLLAKASKAVEEHFVREFAQQMAVFGDDAQFFGDHFGEYAAMIAPDWQTLSG